MLDKLASVINSKKTQDGQEFIFIFLNTYHIFYFFFFVNCMVLSETLESQSGER